MRAANVLLAVAVIGTCFAEWPRAFEFERFAFGDAGWAVTVDHLQTAGQKPTADFSYLYGLLSLLVHRGLFAAFGTDPRVVGGLFVACAALVGFGGWRLLRALEVGVWPRVAFALAIPLAANPGKYPSPVQAMEAALLVHALAYHARGKLAAALLLATLAVFVKPSLGYFYGLLLVVQIVLAWRSSRFGSGFVEDLTPRPPLHEWRGGVQRAEVGVEPRTGSQGECGPTDTVSVLNTPSPFMERGTGGEVLTNTEKAPLTPNLCASEPVPFLGLGRKGLAVMRPLLPAALVGGAVLLALVGTFGLEAVLKTQLPGEAGKVYRDQNCGFFHGDGRAFWDVASGGWIAYAFTPAGAWLAATWLALLGGLLALGRVKSDAAARSLVALAVLHVVFVCVLFANRHSWIYYPYLPFLGAAVALDRLPRWVPAARPVVMATGILAGLFSLVMGYVTLNGAANLWDRTAPDPRTGGLFADQNTVAGWEQVRTRARDGGVFVLTRSSCAAAFGDGIRNPAGCYLSAPVATPTEWAELRAGTARSRWLLVPIWFENTLTNWPELADVLAPFRKADSGPGWEWYERVK